MQKVVTKQSLTSPKELREFIEYPIRCMAKETPLFDIMNPTNFLQIIFCFEKVISIRLTHNNIEFRNGGVFATSDIPPYVLITFFPAHAVKLDNVLHVRYLQGNQEEILEYNNFIDKIKTDHYDNLYGVNEKRYGYKSLRIIGNPEKVDDPLKLGHMIRDGVGNLFSGRKKGELKLNIKNIIAETYIRAKKVINCAYYYDGAYPIIYYVSTRAISKGEELLTIYEPRRWYDKEYGIENDMNSPFITIMLELCKDEKFRLWMDKMNKEIFPDNVM